MIGIWGEKDLRLCGLDAYEGIGCGESQTRTELVESSEELVTESLSTNGFTKGIACGSDGEGE